MDKDRVKGLGLKPVRLEIWHGFLFANLDDDTAPLAPDLALLDEHAVPYRMADLKVVASEDIEIACNCKVLVENFCESYHVFCVHKETLEDNTPTATIENLQGGPGFNHQTMASCSPFAVDAAHRLGIATNGLGRNIFPAMALSIDPGSALWLSVMLDGPHHLKARVWLANMPDEDGNLDEVEDAEARAFCKNFLVEKLAVIEGIRKSLKAGTGNVAALHPWGRRTGSSIGTWSGSLASRGIENARTQTDGRLSVCL